jgi:hypothetical protein
VHVTDLRGRALEGVPVLVAVGRERVLATTAADGSVALREAEGIGFARWPASDASYRTSPVAALTAPGAEPLRFRGIAGRILDPDGAPLGRGLVALRREEDGALVAHAPVSAGGCFAFFEVAPALHRISWKPQIYGDEHGALDGGGGIAEWRTDVVLRMGAGDAIEGIVFGADGKPASGVRLRARLDGAMTGATTGDDGCFRIAGLRVGAVYRLMVFEGGFVPETRDVPAGARDVRFRLDPGLETTGVLLGRDGRPTAAPQILSRTEDGREIRLYPSVRADGRFRLHGLPPGRIRITATLDSATWTWTVEAGARDIVVAPD